MIETEIHRGQHHRVFRVVDPVAGPLIIKRGTDNDNALTAQSALHNEQRILKQLRGLADCPRLVHYDPTVPELAMVDFGGVPLSDAGLLGQPDLECFLTLATALAHQVAEIHGRGVIHKDLNPANIVVRLDDRRVQIIDFDLATTFAEEHPGFDPLSRLPGTPAYLSPEQTGRMNRPVDCRTDLYSLGATLYALATGAPPFGETDTLPLIHAHLARAPRPPGELATWLPSRLSELILALLAKEPDERYRSAAGLAHDLRALRQALAEQAPLTRVQLQARDLPLRPRPPHALYGRSQELAALRAAFASVTRTDDQGGGTQALFIAGYSGVGKTALIHELDRPVTLGDGLFISGKFEQFQRDRPFLAPAQSLRQLCQLLLAEPETAVIRRRERMLAGLGPDAGALFEVIPELEALLGAQTPPPPLGPLESQVRLRALLVALLRQIATPEHPLVLFLDDLQWADQPSLDFIGALLEDPGLHGLLLIGAYRDNETAQGHPLLRLLHRPTANGSPAPVLTLTSLTVSDLNALLADMLQTPAAALPLLTGALFAKTHGNPFFTIAFLDALYRQGALRPDPEQGRWHWDIATILAHRASDNVVDFLAAGLGEFATETAESLVAAACLGNECTLALLALATAQTPDTLTRRLLPALERGVLITPNALAFHQADRGVTLRFCHDRMQQAAYGLRDDAWRHRLHLAMARRFAQPGGDPSLRMHTARHYAAAAPLIIATTERALARDLFLTAAVRARRAGDFTTAERFVRLSLDLLPTDAWHSEHQTAFDLHAELHLTLHSQARQGEADAVYAQLLANSAGPELLVDPTCIQIANLVNRNRYREAIALGCERVARHGLTIPLDDLDRSLKTLFAEFSDVFVLHGMANRETTASIQPETALGQELGAFYRHVAVGALEHLGERAELTDPRLAGAAKLMNNMLLAANACHPILSAWLVLRLGRLWIEEGYCAAALFPMACVGSPLIGMCRDFATAERLARIVLAVGRVREHSRETAHALFFYANYISHWLHPLEEDVAHARQAFRELLRAGDEEFASFVFYPTQAALLDTCARLTDIQAENASALSFAHKVGNLHAEQSYLPYRQLIRSLEGKTAGPGSFTDADFDESTYQLAARENPKALCYFHLYRALAACLFHDEQALACHVEPAVKLSLAIHGHYATALISVLQSLVLIAQIRVTPQASRTALGERLAIHQTWLGDRAAAAPMNFGHLATLVEAQRLDALGQSADAFQAFEQAMRQAQARPWHQALITERAGHCFMRHGLEHAGRALLTRAHALYRQWGATGKARAMRMSLPFLDSGEYGSSGSMGADALDQVALLRASQALASERSLPRLVERVVELLSQLTGATDVRILMADEAGRWHLEGGLHHGESLGRMAVEEAAQRAIISAKGLRLALTTLTSVVSDDAVIDRRFAGDPHFADLPLCSLLGLPVFGHGRLTAFLVLENRLFRAAFTAARIEAVSMLCGQLAISIENARLYGSLERQVADREQALRHAYEQLTAIEVERSRTDERERLLQDMHDGFGSQLASARLRIAHSELTQAQIQVLLHECLDDLYLVVDTMSNEEKSLRDAIVDYRYRCANRLSEQPVRVDWHIVLDACPPIDQRLILQILRIVQEALNNALKHAQASQIDLHAIYQADGQLHITVADDGIGIPEAVEQGRGMGNMQHRARDIGARLHFSRRAPGTCISLSLSFDQEPVLPGP
ncbi:AAA family ATPase [uncultured Thiodictyon sp.]|uniref:AAA family ATPase n=1 Tax=uncultured Thiodictyon sp. TaxID=1846217 RepID=UPI0025DDC294|nr:AAA family ATPase [uncultured Thiodictyon sp.]